MMILGIDATGFAIASTKSTTIALFQVKDRTQEREVTDVAQHCAYRTDGVAIRASTPPGKNANDDKCCHCHTKRQSRTHPHIYGIERIRIVVFGNGSQSVVNPHIEGLQQVGGYTPIGAVGGNEDCKTVQSCYHQHQEQQKHQSTKHTLRWRITVFVGQLRLLVFAEHPTLANPRNNVLHHTQGANDRTIDASKQESQQNKPDNYAHVQSQYSRQELNLRHPGKIVLCCSREIEEEHSHSHPKDDGQCDTDFS